MGRFTLAEEQLPVFSGNTVTGRCRVLGGVVLLTMLACVSAQGATHDATGAQVAPGYAWEKELLVTMRDGVRLSTDVLLPRGSEARRPTVLVRTPYDKDRHEWPVQKRFLEAFLARGYAVVLQSERGRWFSEGVYSDYLAGANTDGYDTLDWIVKQRWSNGKVGTLGCSSSGEQQWGIASGNHPAHAAMLPIASGTAVGAIPGNDTQGAIYRGGVPQTGLWAWWYHDMAPTERLIVPSDASREQRIRLRTAYQLQPKPEFFHLAPDGSLDWLRPKVDFSIALKPLPSMDTGRRFGGPLTPYDEYATWGPADPRWQRVSTVKSDARPRVPALHVSTWHDVGVGETTRLYKHLQDVGTPNQHLIIGAGPHCLMFWDEPRFADLTFGDLAVGDARYGGADRGYERLFLDWFDQWVAGKAPTAQIPPVQLYVMHRGWVSGSRYPLPDVLSTPFYLATADPGVASIDSGALQIAAHSQDGRHDYVYDPDSPTPTRGGGCCEVDNALDQRPVEARRDVLVYSTRPLEKPLSIAGPVSVTLYVSSSARDTDFMVKLVDVFPDGRAINLADDAFRVRYRTGFDRPSPMKPGEVYEITLTNMVAGNRFRKGHRIRLEVASANFPLFERNLNTGKNNFDETSWVVARNSVHFGKRHPSRVVLPVIPE